MSTRTTAIANNIITADMLATTGATVKAITADNDIHVIVFGSDGAIRVTPAAARHCGRLSAG